MLKSPLFYGSPLLGVLPSLTNFSHSFSPSPSFLSLFQCQSLFCLWSVGFFLIWFLCFIASICNHRQFPWLSFFLFYTFLSHSTGIFTFSIFLWIYTDITFQESFLQLFAFSSFECLNLRLLPFFVWSSRLLSFANNATTVSCPLLTASFLRLISIKAIFVSI